MKLKKHFGLLTLMFTMAISIVVCSCDKVEPSTSTTAYNETTNQHPDDKTSETLVVSPTEVTLDNVNLSAELSVTSNTLWNVTISGAWLSVSKMSGTKNDKLKITAQGKTSDSRSTEITIKTTSGSVTRIVNVKQEPPLPKLTVQEYSKEICFDSEGTEASFIVTTDPGTEWNISFDSNWCKVSQTSGKGSSTGIDLTVGKYDTGTRSATMTISTKDGRVKLPLKIIQNSTEYYTRTNKNYNWGWFNASGSDGTQIKVVSNEPWDFSSEEDWVTAMPSGGTGSQIVSLRIKKLTSTESRMTRIDFRGRNSKKACHLWIRQIVD